MLIIKIPFYLQQLFYKEMSMFYYLTILHQVSYVQKELILCYAILFDIGSLTMISWGSKHVGILTLILYYKYRNQKSVHFDL